MSSDYGQPEELENCERCSVEVKPAMEENRQGGCALCRSASIKYNAFPCKQCAEEETPTVKFPRFQRAKIWRQS